VNALARAPGADPFASRLPVTLITGFLGSGKTTLLRRLLTHPGMHNAAVVINEYGDVPLDHELVAASSEQMTLLSNGCLCCTLRTDLQETLRELFVKRRAGEVIDFDRVFVETTGLADPIPVLHTLQTDGLLGAQYRLNGVVTVVDAVNGMGQLDTQPEAVKQAAVADRIVVSKADIAQPAEVGRLVERLRAMNGYAQVATAVQGEVDPAWLASIAPARVSAPEEDLERWLPRAAAARRAAGEGGALTGELRPVAGAHDAGIESFCLWFDKPFTWERLNAALQALAALRGPDLLRVKGIVHVAGEPGPIVIQGAQHVFHPPVALAAAHETDPRSRIVFIVRNVPRASVESLFAAVNSL
jgi:G3E family GTPase